MNFINLLNKALEVLGLILSPVIVKLLSAFYRQAEQGAMIPAALLRGVPGAGKTSTAEAFALAVGAKRYFYQCNPGTGMDQLIGQPNLAAVLRQDSKNAVSDGILIQAVKAAITGEDVVLILDEIDKASPETDSYLLDFLQSRRIHDSTMQELIVPSDVKFWVFLTSNAERDLSDALMRRVKRFNIERPSRSVVAEVLGINEDAALIDIWQSCDSLAISQLQQYLQDGGDPEDIDTDLLGQYIDDIPEIADAEEEDNRIPGAVEVTFSISDNDDVNISMLSEFTWRQYGVTSLVVSIRSFTELVRLMDAGMPGRWLDDSRFGDKRMYLDTDIIKPVVHNDAGAIFSVRYDEGYGTRSVALVARKDKLTGQYYMSGEDLYHIGDDLFRALANSPELRKAAKAQVFKAKQAEELQKARKEASVCQAAHILTSLGLDDLI